MTEGIYDHSISKLAIAQKSYAYHTEEFILDRKKIFKTIELHKKSVSAKDEYIVQAKIRDEALTVIATLR